MSLDLNPWILAAVVAMTVIRHMKRGSEISSPYGVHSTKTGKGSQEFSNGGPSITKAAPQSKIVCLDLDGTVVGDDKATAEFKHLWESHFRPMGAILVYNTGRAMDAYKLLVEQTKAPILRPDFFIGTEGCEIQAFNGNSMHPLVCDEWPKYFTTKWDIEEVRSVVRDISSQFADAIRPHPPGSSSNEPFRESVVIQGQAIAAELTEMIKQALSKTKTEALVYFCGGVYVDGKKIEDRFWVGALPVAAGKGNALKFLCSKLEIEASNVFVCGDSGNDIPMLRKDLAHCTCIVGNAHGELLAWLEAESDTHYKANRHCAGGIVEGLQHYGWC